MNFTLSDEQTDLQAMLRRFLEARSDHAAVRRAMASERGYDDAVWSAMCRDLGLAGLGIPEDLGGAGGSYLDVGIVFEELGRALTPAPYFSTMGLAVPALLASGDESAMRRHVPRIAEGRTIAAVAFAEDRSRWDWSRTTTEATSTTAGWTLTGHKMFVIDGAVADVVLVLARTEAGLSLFEVDPDSAGVVRTPLEVLDGTRRQSRIDLAAAEAQLVGCEGEGGRLIEHVLDRASVAIAAEALGGAQRVLEMAVDYAKQRVQFGRPIGSFQAVKHLCADALLGVESARSAAYYAMWAATSAPDELTVAAPMAKSYCTDAFFAATAANIQIHGGIGFTWDHPAHLYFKRAKTLQALFGAPRDHRRLLLDRLDAASPRREPCPSVG